MSSELIAKLHWCLSPALNNNCPSTAPFQSPIKVNSTSIERNVQGWIQPTNLTVSQPTSLNVSLEVGPHQILIAILIERKSDRVPSNAGHPLDPPLTSPLTKIWMSLSLLKTIVISHRRPKLMFCTLYRASGRAIYKTLYVNLTDISKWLNMCRNVKTSRWGCHCVLCVVWGRF